MFFLRMAFWLGVVVLLLPTDAQQQSRLLNTATSAVERASTFCDRNAKACEMGAQAWSTFLKKAEFGARLVGDLLSSSGRQSDASAAPKAAAGAKSDVKGTLSQTDLEPAWRGPTVRRAGI